MFKYKGVRIRKIHMNIVKIYLVLLSLPFIACIVLSYLFLFKESGILGYVYLGVSVVALFLCLFLFYRRNISNGGFFVRLEHKQLLAKMLVNNNMYVKKTVKKSNPNGGNSSKEKIAYFPKVFYRYKKGFLYIRFPTDLQNFQDKFVKMRESLEIAFYADCINIVYEKKYILYEMLYDPVKARITIKDMKIEKGKLKLMEGVLWDFEKVPHALIAGGTGSGKSYLILALIYVFAKGDFDFYILDPKMSDLSFLKRVPSLSDKVFYEKDKIEMSIRLFYEEMVKRQKVFSEIGEGKKYHEIGFKPMFLVFDEYVAFLSSYSSAEYKDQQKILYWLNQIVLLGRQLGLFLIMGMQRPDAKFLPDGMRDQFGLRVALGAMSEIGYDMMFGDNQKAFKNLGSVLKGWGYAVTGEGDIITLFAPFIPAGFDFVNELATIYGETAIPVIEAKKEVGKTAIVDVKEEVEADV